MTRRTKPLVILLSLFVMLAPFATAQAQVDEDEDKEEGMKMNEGHSRFEELAFGKMRPAPQPGVETDSQVEESHGTLLRRRYFGRY